MYKKLNNQRYYLKDHATTDVDFERFIEISSFYSLNIFSCFSFKSKLISIFTNDFITDFEAATILLEKLRADDPYRLEDMDVLSNMYYVNGQKSDLANLAHHCDEIDKFRVETCCVIGNLLQNSIFIF